MRLGIETKIVGGFLMLALLVATVGYFNFTNIQRIDASFNALENYHTPALDSINSMKAEASGIFASALKFEFIKSAAEQTEESRNSLMEERIRISEGNARFKGAFEKYGVIAGKYASLDEQGFVRVIGKKWDVFANATGRLISLKDAGAPNTEVLEAKGDMEEAEASLLDTLNSVHAYEESAASGKRQTADTLVRNTLISTVLVLAVSIIGALGAGLLISAEIVKPLKQLKNASDEIARGNLDAKIDVRSGDEIEALAVSFGKMAYDLKYSRELSEGRIRELEEGIEEIKRASKITARDLKISELKKRIDELEREEKDENAE